VAPLLQHTVLYVTDAVENVPLHGLTSSHSSYEPVAATSAQAPAYLLVNRRIEAVLLDRRGEMPSNTGLPHTLRVLRKDIPIVAVSDDPKDGCDGADACVCLREGLNEVLPLLDVMLEAYVPW
jgi:hypothetical protein